MTEDVLDKTWGLIWCQVDDYEEATVGDYKNGNGVLFTLEHYPTCYRRGPWRLLVEVAAGPRHNDWGCFDDADQPMRWYHRVEHARLEAAEIGRVLMADYIRRSAER